jgi:hypothetical protein
VRFPMPRTRWVATQESSNEGERRRIVALVGRAIDLRVRPLDYPNWRFFPVRISAERQDGWG